MKASPFLFVILCCASITDNEILNDRCSKVSFCYLVGCLRVWVWFTLFVGLEILEEIPQILYVCF